MGLSNLPPGCSDFDIPGNRPEDVLADRLWEALTREDVREVHEEHVTACDHAVWPTCRVCGGTGQERPGPDDAGRGDGLECPVCEGAGFRYGSCEYGIVLGGGWVDSSAEWGECPYVKSLIEERIEEAKR